MKDLKLTLVVPNFRWIESDKSVFWHFVPINLCLLAAMVEDICEVEIIDAYIEDLDADEFIATLVKSDPDVVGITVLMDQFAPTGHYAAKLAKDFNPNMKVLMGGVYCTVNPDLAAQDENVDYVVIGEGEYAMRDLLGYFVGKNPLPEKGICYRVNGKIINTGHADFIHDLDAIPLPAYHLVDFERYSNEAPRESVDSPRSFPYANVITSRGCPIGCSFCQVSTIAGRKFRPRSAENVLKEIAWLKETYSIRSIIFTDDNLFTDKKRAKAIFQGMIDRGMIMPWVSTGTAVFQLDEEMIELMRESGCDYICIAIESGTERVRKNIVRKPINYDHAKKMAQIAKQYGIYVAANFIIGFPTETWDEIRGTIRFAEDLDVDYVKIFHAIPLKHTRLWDLCVKEGAFRKGFEQSKIRWSVGQIQGKEFSCHDLTILRAYEWDRINFSSSEKHKKTARMMHITEEELFQIRRETLLNVHRNIHESFRESG